MNGDQPQAFDSFSGAPVEQPPSTASGQPTPSASAWQPAPFAASGQPTFSAQGWAPAVAGLGQRVQPGQSQGVSTHPIFFQKTTHTDEDPQPCHELLWRPVGLDRPNADLSLTPEQRKQLKKRHRDEWLEHQASQRVKRKATKEENARRQAEYRARVDAKKQEKQKEKAADGRSAKRAKKAKAATVSQPAEPEQPLLAQGQMEAPAAGAYQPFFAQGNQPPLPAAPQPIQVQALNGQLMSAQVQIVHEQHPCQPFDHFSTLVQVQPPVLAQGNQVQPQAGSRYFPNGFSNDGLILTPSGPVGGQLAYPPTSAGMGMNPVIPYPVPQDDLPQAQGRLQPFYPQSLDAPSMTTMPGQFTILGAATAGSRPCISQSNLLHPQAAPQASSYPDLYTQGLPYDVGELNQMDNSAFNFSPPVQQQPQQNSYWTTFNNPPALPNNQLAVSWGTPNLGMGWYPQPHPSVPQVMVLSPVQHLPAAANYPPPPPNNQSADLAVGYDGLPSPPMAFLPETQDRSLQTQNQLLEGEQLANFILEVQSGHSAGVGLQSGNGQEAFAVVPAPQHPEAPLQLPQAANEQTADISRALEAELNRGSSLQSEPNQEVAAAVDPELEQEAQQFPYVSEEASGEKQVSAAFDEGQGESVDAQASSAEPAAPVTEEEAEHDPGPDEVDSEFQDLFALLAEYVYS